MTSRLTLSAIVFSILSTAALVGTAQADTAGNAASTTLNVQLDRVVITVANTATKT